LEMEATSESAMLLACVRASAGVLDPVAMCASLLVINVIGLAIFVAKKRKRPSAAFGFYKLFAANFAPYVFMLIAISFVTADDCAWHPVFPTMWAYNAGESWETGDTPSNKVDMWSAQIFQLSFANMILLGLPFLARVAIDMANGDGGQGNRGHRRGGSNRGHRRGGSRGRRR
jgi:hypothetical protein